MMVDSDTARVFSGMSSARRSGYSSRSVNMQLLSHPTILAPFSTYGYSTSIFARAF